MLTRHDRDPFYNMLAEGAEAVARKASIRSDLRQGMPPEQAGIRTFSTGATRDQNDNKPDYLGFLSARYIKRFGAYMMKHQLQANGEKRAADNWKKGIPIPAYAESLFRHAMEFHDAVERGELDRAEEVALAIGFNVQGFIHEREKEREGA